MRKTLHTLFAGTALFLTMSAGATKLVINTGTSGNNFAPVGSTTISLGDTVMWQWVGGSHNTDGVAGNIPSGATAWHANLNSTATTFTYIPSAIGTYNYTCTFHSGMSGSFTVVCGGGPSSRPVITSTNGNRACQGSAITMSIPTQGGATYQWFNGTATIANTTNSLNATTAGSYTIKVSRCGFDSTSLPFVVTIDTLPRPAFTETHTGLAYTFTNTTPSSAGHSYVWTISDGSPAQTTTNATRTFTAAGTYTVTLKATNTTTTCFATSSPLTIQATLGVGTLAGESYSILPNPATSVINVSTSVNASLILMDFSGRAIAAPVTGSNKQQQMNVSGLPAGIYLLRIRTASGAATEKITVTH